MELIQAICQDGKYECSFLEQLNNATLAVTIQFEDYWRFTPKPNLLEEFGKSVGSYRAGDIQSYPYDIKTHLESIPVHIPNTFGRFMFKSAIELLIKETDAPVHVHIVEHPGYPLLVVTYDTSIISYGVVIRWVDSIMESIVTCTPIITENEVVSEEEEEVDLLDDVDEAVIVEFDFEEELKQAIKLPAENVVLAMEGE